jgi:hypothetical protein
VPWATRCGRLITAGSAVAIAGLTLLADPGAAAAAARTSLLCLVCGDRGGVDVVLNLILFMPLGLGVRLAGVRVPRAIAVAAAFSCTIELLQLTAIPGRDASLSDLITNTLGGGFGAGVATRLPLLLFPDRRVAWRLLLGGAVGWLLLLGLSGWLLSPSYGDGELGSAWADGPAPQVFTGRVLEVSRSGVVQPRAGIPPDSAELRQALREGRIALSARVVTGPGSGARRWIYVIGENGWPRLDLSQQGRDLVLGLPAHSQRVLLGTPSVLLRGAFPGDTGREVTVHAEAANRVVRLAAERAPVRREVTVALSPAMGWTLIAPFGLGLGPRVPLLTALGLLGLTLPLGYWAGRHRRPGPAVLVLAATLAIGLGGIAAVGGFPPVAWSEWLGAGAGAAAGWALVRGAAYLQTRCGSPSIAESSSS